MNDPFAITVYKLEGRSYSLINAQTDHLGYVGIARMLSNDPDVSRVYLLTRYDNCVLRLYKGGERVA